MRSDPRSVLWALVFAIGAWIGTSSCATATPPDVATPIIGAPVARGGAYRSFADLDGHLKGWIYSTAELSSRPLLIIVLHGDIPNPPPSYQYDFAQAVTEGFGAVAALPKAARPLFGKGPGFRDLVAAGLLRPGYADPTGARSDGEMGYGIADNYTARVVDDLAAAIRQLQSEFNPRATILVGHSGGASIMADLLGRDPGIASAALLVACGCDPQDRRARWKAEHPDPRLDEPNPSLLPLALAGSVSGDVTVRLIVGASDENSLPEYSEHYARALRRHGVDAAVTVLPGLSHDILFSPPTFTALAQLLAKY